MEEIQALNDDKPIVGATSRPDAQESHATATTDELPMIVWLKGDEPYVEEFCLDADAAMEELGIKRSRLTQISGRELRVGRIRIDRYTRPMYRAVDIEGYKKWSRATATHQRSSSAIKDAASQLQNHTEEISATLENALENSSSHVRQALEQFRNEANENYQGYLKQTRNLTEEVKHRFLEQTARAQEELRSRIDELVMSTQGLQRQFEAIIDVTNQQQQMDKQLKAMQVQFDSLNRLIEGSVKDSQALEQKNAAANRDIGKALGMIIQFLRESSSKQEKIATAIDQQQQWMLLQNQDRPTAVKLRMPSRGPIGWGCAPTRRHRSESPRR